MRVTSEKPCGAGLSSQETLIVRNAQAIPANLKKVAQDTF